MAGQVHMACVVSFQGKGMSVVADVKAGFDKAAAAAQQFQKSVRSAGAEMGRAFGNTRIGAGGAAWLANNAERAMRALPRLMKDYGDFEETLARAKGVIGYRSQQEATNIRQLRLAALSMRGTEFGPNELAKGLLELNRAGIEGARGVVELSTVANLATVASIGMKDSAIAVANAIQAWGGSGRDGAAVMNIMNNAASSTSFELKNFTHAMTYAQGVSQAFNQSLESTAALVGMLAPVTGPTTKAGTAARSFLSSLGSEKVQKELAKQGVDIYERGPDGKKTGRFADVLDILASYSDKASKAGPVGSATKTIKQFKLRGTDPVTAMTRLMNEGVYEKGQFYTGFAAKDAWKRKIAEGNVSLEDQAKLVRDSLPKAWDAFKAKVEKTLIEVGGKLKEFVALPFFDMAGKTLGALSAVVRSPIGGLVAAGAGALTLGFIVRALGRASSVMWQTLGYGAGVERGAAGMGGIGSGLGGAMMGATLLNGQVASTGSLRAMDAFRARMALMHPTGAAFNMMGSSLQAAMLGASMQNVGAPNPFAQQGGFQQGVRNFVAPVWGMGAAGSRMMGGSGALGKVGSIVGGALGGIAGFAGSLLGMVGPMGLVMGGLYGLIEVLDSINEKHERQRRGEATMLQTVTGLPLVAQALRYMALDPSNQNLKPGQQPYIPNNVMDAIQANPTLGAQLAQAHNYAARLQDAPNRDEILRRFGVQNVYQAATAVLGQSDINLARVFLDRGKISQSQFNELVPRIRSWTGEGLNALRDVPASKRLAISADQTLPPGFKPPANVLPDWRKDNGGFFDYATLYSQSDGQEAAALSRALLPGVDAAMSSVFDKVGSGLILEWVEFLRRANDTLNFTGTVVLQDALGKKIGDGSISSQLAHKHPFGGPQGYVD